MLPTGQRAFCATLLQRENNILRQHYRLKEQYRE